MHSDTIPTLDDLTADWFTGLLRSTGDLAGDRAVASVRLEPFGSVESMMSALHRAALTFDGPTDAPTTLIVKLASSSERQRFIADMFKFYERFLCVRKLPVPVIAAINGAAIGAGACFATACDMRVAAAGAKIGFTFPTLGLHPGM